MAIAILSPRVVCVELDAANAADEEEGVRRLVAGEEADAALRLSNPLWAAFGQPATVALVALPPDMRSRVTMPSAAPMSEEAIANLIVLGIRFGWRFDRIVHASDLAGQAERLGHSSWSTMSAQAFHEDKGLGAGLWYLEGRHVNG